jgi:hypothetical protein
MSFHAALMSSQSRMIAANGPEWSIWQTKDGAAARWEFGDLSDMEIMEHCSWYGVTCCQENMALKQARKNGMLMSMGALGWKNYGTRRELTSTSVSTLHAVQPDQVCAYHTCS